MSDMSNQETPLRVAFYIRVSTDEQVEKYGIGLQRQSLESLIKSKGKLSDGVTDRYLFAGEQYVYVDQAISGTIDLRERPAFGRLEEDIVTAPESQKPFDVVAVYKIDRFARKLKILLDVIDFFENYDIKFISANESIDTGTPFGKAILGIVGVLAELELETIKDRTHAGRSVAIGKGVFMGTNPPYGYIKNPEKKLVIQQEEADQVKYIFDNYLDRNMSVQAIATELHHLQVPSPDTAAMLHKKRKGDSKKRKNDLYFWPHSKVRGILGNEIYIGKYYYNKTKGGVTLPKNEWKLSTYRTPEIIDPSAFMKAQERLAQGKANANSVRSGHVYLLAGLLRCDCCYDSGRDKERVVFHGSKKEYLRGKYTYSYICSRKDPNKSTVRCDSLPLPADQIENYVVERIKEIISNPVEVYKYQQELESSKKDIEHANRRLASLKSILSGTPKRKENIRKQHEIGVIDTPELERNFVEIGNTENNCYKEINEIEQRLNKYVAAESALSGFKIFSEKYLATLQDIDNNREGIKTILSAIVDKIVVYSRELENTDVIAGRKKLDQQIPYRIDIYLKLPQGYLQELANNKGTHVTTMQDIKTFWDKQVGNRNFSVNKSISPNKDKAVTTAPN